MGIFDFLKFGKKEKGGSDPDYKSALGLSPPVFDREVPADFMRPPQMQPLTAQPPARPAPMTNEAAVQENMKAKIDLLATQMDSMRIQSDSMNERLVQIERMVKQLIEMARSGRPF